MQGTKINAKMRRERRRGGEMVLSVGLVLLELIGVSDVSALRGMHVSVPEAVRAGASVTLHCEYDLEGEALYAMRWYHGDEEFYRYVPQESPPYKVFPTPLFDVDMSLSDSRQVTLRQVTHAISGYYKCEVSADAPFFHTDIRAQHMTVVEVPMEGPTLSTEVRKVAAGAPLRANCTGPNSPLAVNLTWYVNGERLVEQGPNAPRGVARLALPTAPAMFRHGRLRLRCLATMFTLYRRTDELEILEDTPQVAMVMRPTANYQLYDGYNHASVISPISTVGLVIILSTALT